MEKHDSDSGNSHADEKDVGHAQHAEHALDRFPDPDVGLSEEEKAAIVSCAFFSDFQDVCADPAIGQETRSLP